MLTKDEIRNLITSADLVKNFVDLETQLQPAGMDLTLAEVEAIAGGGQLDFDNRERKLPETQSIKFSGDWILLNPGIYKIRYNEVVRIPKDIAALARPRSTMLRCGCYVQTAVWDPGYEGRSESLLVVSNPAGVKLKKNSRVVQLVFFRLRRETEGYAGAYHRENI